MQRSIRTTEKTRREPPFIEIDVFAYFLVSGVPVTDTRASPLLYLSHLWLAHVVKRRVCIGTRMYGSFARSTNYCRRAEARKQTKRNASMGMRSNCPVWIHATSPLIQEVVSRRPQSRFNKQPRTDLEKTNRPFAPKSTNEGTGESEKR